MIYLDNAATSFPKPQDVCDIMDTYNRSCSVNAGRGSYSLAKKADEVISLARGKVAKLFGVSSRDVFFAPSDTYAMNCIINGLKWDTKKNVYITPFEHNAVIRPLHLKKAKGMCEIFVIPFKNDYSLDGDELERLFAINPPDYIFINHASNVSGAIISVEDIAQLAKKYAATIVLDVAQTIGLLDMRSIKQYVDLIAFAGHKNMQGPIGIGGFVNISHIHLDVSLAGGNGSDSLNPNMPEEGCLRFEIGSPNVVSIAGLSAGIDWVENVGANIIAQHKNDIIEYLISQIKGIDKVRIFSIPKASYKIGVLSFVVDGYESVDVGQILNDEFDIAVRTGYHCAPLVHDFLDDKKYGGTVRVSVGYYTTKEEIDKLIFAIRSL